MPTLRGIEQLMWRLKPGTQLQVAWGRPAKWYPVNACVVALSGSHVEVEWREGRKTSWSNLSLNLFKGTAYNGPLRQGNFIIAPKKQRRARGFRQKCKIIERQQHACNMCGKFLKGSEAELDHIVPLCVNGDDRDENLQMLHKACHKKKTRGDRELLKLVQN